MYNVPSWLFISVIFLAGCQFFPTNQCEQEKVQLEQLQKNIQNLEAEKQLLIESNESLKTEKIEVAKAAQQVIKRLNQMQKESNSLLDQNRSLSTQLHKVLTEWNLQKQLEIQKILDQNTNNAQVIEEALNGIQPDSAEALQILEKAAQDTENQPAINNNNNPSLDTEIPAIPPQKTSSKKSTTSPYPSYDEPAPSPTKPSANTPAPNTDSQDITTLLTRLAKKRETLIERRAWTTAKQETFNAIQRGLSRKPLGKQERERWFNEAEALEVSMDLELQK